MFRQRRRMQRFVEPKLLQIMPFSISVQNPAIIVKQLLLGLHFPFLRLKADRFGPQDLGLFRSQDIIGFQHGKLLR